ncbi:hypothetical protein [Streptomyces asiaticus]|uniref:hypothetical protein n=1 Tax=Streptomyces asiaticus TaxID=114695 RepID=UPI003F67869D
MTVCPAGDEHRRRAGLLQYRTHPKVLGTVFAYRPGPVALELWYDLCRAYKERVGDKKQDVQPPYRSLEAILRAVLGTWARWDVSDGRAQLLTGAEMPSEDRRDAFCYWGEAVLPGEPGHAAIQRMADAIATAPALPYPDLPRSVAGRRSLRWWPGELARWRLAEDLAAINWRLGGEKPARFVLCTDGTLAATATNCPAPRTRRGGCAGSFPASRSAPLLPGTPRVMPSPSTPSPPCWPTAGTRSPRSCSPTPTRPSPSPPTPTDRPGSAGSTCPPWPPADDWPDCHA